MRLEYDRNTKYSKLYNCYLDVVEDILYSITIWHLVHLYSIHGGKK